MRDRSVWGPPAVALAMVPVLLAPWWLPALLHGAGPAVLLDAGQLPMTEVGFRELITGRIGDQGAPWWLGILLVVLAAVALVPARTRIPVLVCWIVAFVAALLAAGLALLSFELAAVDTAAGLGSSWSPCRRPSWSPPSSAHTDSWAAGCRVATCVDRSRCSSPPWPSSSPPPAWPGS